MNDTPRISRRKWENNINMCLKERELSAVGLIYLAQDLEEPMVGPCKQKPFGFHKMLIKCSRNDSPLRGVTLCHITLLNRVVLMLIPIIDIEYSKSSLIRSSCGGDHPD
jgi:hypothetical protein